MLRIIAVDWSGARAGAERKIWLAEATGGGIVRLAMWDHREELLALPAVSDETLRLEGAIWHPAWAAAFTAEAAGA